jgi:Tol biopolymer transport system component
MAWPVLAVAWLVWTHASEAPCEAGGPLVARQRLNGPPTGVAKVDVSADGRFVAFVSLARLASADDNTLDDIYVLDRSTGQVGLETLATGGRASNGSSDHPRLSGDGRSLVFSTVARNLVGADDDALRSQVLRRDRATGSTLLVSHTPAELPGNGWSGHPDVSDDGRYVVFESRATDLAGSDANAGGTDIYVFDAADRSIRRVSLTSQGQQPATGQSTAPAISGTGRFIAFTSTAPLDVAGLRLPQDAPSRAVFLRDLTTGETRRISGTRDGRVPNGASYYPAISADGRRVAFVSTATNLDDDHAATRQENIYLYDRDKPRLRLLSRSASGGTADGASRHPAVSGNGRDVVFSSDASNLQCADDCSGARADLNLVSDVYRVDLASGIAERVSSASDREPWWTTSEGAAVDASGSVVAFSSRQPLDDADLDHDDELFIAVMSRPGGTPADARRAEPCGSARRPAEPGR